MTEIVLIAHVALVAQVVVVVLRALPAQSHDVIQVALIAPYGQVSYTWVHAHKHTYTVYARAALVDKIMRLLKDGKAAGLDSLTAEY